MAVNVSSLRRMAKLESALKIWRVRLWKRCGTYISDPDWRIVES